MRKRGVLEIHDSLGPGNERDPASQEASGVPFSSNLVRLSWSEWVVVGIVLSAILCLVPGLWERLERFEPEPDYRLPYELGSDYWLYKRYCRWARARYQVLVIGDSVIWGHYVPKHETLSHYLNEIAAGNQFANLGVDGIHPVALAGLMKYYGLDITGKNVILHLNPLWMSSRKHDLQIEEKEFHFNHPRLVPQFIPKIPCYKESYSRRLSALIERYVPFSSWASHLRKAYLDSMALPAWTIEHPHKNPLKAVTLKLPEPQSGEQGRQISWVAKGAAKADFQWVDLGTSLQWKFFQRSVETLQARGNRVFVLVGPFNEHMLKGKSAQTYRNIKDEIKTWLQQKAVAYYMPPALPGELYCDASHPMAEGYATLAKQLFENEAFRSLLLPAHQ